jgi:hypothetical protein
MGIRLAMSPDVGPSAWRETLGGKCRWEGRAPENAGGDGEECYEVGKGRDHLPTTKRGME